MYRYETRTSGKCGAERWSRPTRVHHTKQVHARGAGPQTAGQPTADCRSPTRSVRSQVNSGSSRPKWPYAAVRW